MLAMGYSVTVSAAELLMKTLYSQLFANTDVSVAIRIPYSASSTDVSAQVLQLKDKKPDVAIFISYTADSILYLKTLKNFDYRPPMVLGAGTPTDSAPEVGSTGEGAPKGVTVMGEVVWSAVRIAGRSRMRRR